MKNLHNIKFLLVLGVCSLTVWVSAYAASLQEDLNVASYAILRRDDDFARHKYKQITVQYPREAKAWNAYGEFLLHKNELSDAQAAFEKALAVDSQYPGAHLRLGKIAYRNKNYTEALNHFEFEKSKTGDAHYWTARVYEAQGNVEAAGKNYAKASRKKTDYLDAADLGRYASELSGREDSAPLTRTEGRPWDLRLGSGFIYTDNAAASDDKTLRPADMKHRWDFGWDYNLAAAYRMVDTDHFDLTARYDFDHLIHFEAEDFNQLTNRIQLDPETHFGNFTLGTNLFWEHQTLGGDPYRHTWGARPWVGYLWNRFQFVTGYEWNDGKYHFTPANGKQDHDNEVHKMDHGVIYYPEKFFSYLNLGMSYGEERSKGSDYNSRFLQTYFAFNTREWHELSFNASVYTGWNNHLQPDTGALITESQRRRGQDFGFHTEIVKRFGDSGFRVYGRYEYDRRASNITFYSSTVNTVSTGVKYDF